MRRGSWVVFATALVFVLALSGGALAGKPADPGAGKGKGNGKDPASAADPSGGKSAASSAAPWQGGWIHDYTEAPWAQTQSDYFVVVFRDPPAASYAGGIRGLKATKPARGQKLNTRSQEARAYAEYLKSVHANYHAFLKSKAPEAEVVASYTFAANAVAVKANGAKAEILQQGPGIRTVTASWVYRPTMTVSNDLINAPALWGALGGRAEAGSGIKVGIIDTGIRDDHEAFDCKGDTITHKAYASGGNPPPFNLPTIVFNHGTHVAGTVAGCVTELVPTEDDPTSGTWSGVAPGAELHDYNVFPGFGGGFIAFGGSAFSHDICRAIEDSLADGMDVINMSLGGRIQGPHDFLAECTQGAVEAGLVAAVAAGNSGPGDSTVESPGSAPGALTAGASTNPHFVGVQFDATTSEDTSVSGGAAYGDFPHFGDVEDEDYTRTTPLNGCTAISEDLTGKIALIDRGVCTFGTKVRNAAAKGAVGVLVANNVAGDPSAMGSDGGAMPIPAAMVSKTDGAALGSSGTISIAGEDLSEFLTENEDIIAGFSSRGPTAFTSVIKPDITAPGVNVHSAAFNEEDPDELGYAYFQGTSMATPHVAGAAALLLDANPGWTPADVKSALVQTAKRPVWDHVNGTAPTGVLTRGGGRIDLAAAMTAPTRFDPASVSFGFWNGNKPVQASATLTMAGAGCGTPTVTGTTSDLGVAATISGTTLTLALTGGRAAGSGDYEGDVEVVCGGQTLRIPWWVRIDRNGKP